MNFGLISSLGIWFALIIFSPCNNGNHRTFVGLGSGIYYTTLSSFVVVVVVVVVVLVVVVVVVAAGVDWFSWDGLPWIGIGIIELVKFRSILNFSWLCCCEEI
jgi:hypothetical protein